MNYKPIPPADLVDALQGTIHKEIGRSRPARAARKQPKNVKLESQTDEKFNN